MEWQSAASASGKELSAVGGGVVIAHSLSLNFFSHSSLSLVPVSHCLSSSYPPMCCHLQLYTGRHKAQQNIAQMKMPISQR